MQIFSKFISRNFFIFCSIIILSISVSKAQDSSSVDRYNQQLNLGLGFGLDYGGIGIRLTGLPDKHLALFVAAGSNLNGLGFNGGASYRFTPLRKACWYYTMMYGYNAVIVIENASEYNQTYYGISTGMGVELHSRRHPGNFWNLEFLIPIRSQEFQNDLDDIKNNPYIDLKSEPLPFAFCVGFHFRLE